ncbi:hypothetical protein [Bacillus mycoides]|uniref:hypothetical protein n=1 Tax=Bacillus mycoides TaxID=1405 RepID=UPI003D1E9A8B
MAYYDGRIDFCKLYGLYQGDRIRVFSAGQPLGVGSFIRMEGPLLVWVDRHANMNFTDLRVSSIRKINGGCCDLDNDVIVTDL